MKRQEAFSVLELPQNSSEEEIKKRYRELTKKYHPDINKDTGAEAHFKKINEAYSSIQNPEPEPSSVGFRGYNQAEYAEYASSFQDIFSNFVNPIRSNYRPPPDIKLTANISFEESIIGCNRDVSFNRYIKCEPCNGDGSLPIKTDLLCSDCKGSGRVERRVSNTVITQPCQKCGGVPVPREACTPCAGRGSQSTSAQYTISIPAGVEPGSILRLSRAGHYFKNPIIRGDTLMDAYLIINVGSHATFRREGDDVISDLNVSLLEALAGCKRKCQTVHGEVEIDILAGTKNKDEIRKASYGVKDRRGSHRFLINVEYPKETAQIIETLRKLEN